MPNCWNCIFVYFRRLFPEPPTTGYPHKVVTRDVSFDGTNPATLLINVFYLAELDDSVVLTNAVVKDNSGTVVAEVDPVPNVAQAQKYVTLTLSLSSNLSSGNYTVTLLTSKVGSFVSPSFTVP